MKIKPSPLFLTFLALTGAAIWFAFARGSSSPHYDHTMEATSEIASTDVAECLRRPSESAPGKSLHNPFYVRFDRGQTFVSKDQRIRIVLLSGVNTKAVAKLMASEREYVERLLQRCM